MAKISFFSLGGGSTPVTGYVPYTGATQNVDLGSFGLEGDFIQFSLNPTQALQEGRLAWNDAEGTLDLRMKGNNVTQQIGEETFYYVKNQSGATITNGTLVRASGTNGGSGHILVEPFLADGTYPSTYVMGIVTEDIANGDFGFVTAFGKVRGIQTNGANYGETWVDGQILYGNSTISGGMTKTLPTSPNNKVEIAIVINASANNGTLFVRPTFFPNIFQDEGTNISNPQANEFLAYDDTQEVWINRLLGVADLPTNIPATNIADGSVSDTEFQYLNGVTSDIQSQIDSKQNALLYTPVYLYTKNNTTYSSSGTGSQIIHSLLIPANTFTSGDILRVTARFKKVGTNSTSASSIYINNSISLSGGKIIRSNPFAATTLANGQQGTVVIINNVNLTQLPFTPSSATDIALSTSAWVDSTAIDWTATQYILFSCAPNNIGDVVSLIYYQIEKL